MQNDISNIDVELLNDDAEDIVNDLVESIRLALVNEQPIIPIIGFDTIPIKEGNKYVPYLDFLSNHIATEKNITLNNHLTGFDLFNDLSHQLLVVNQFDKQKTTKQISSYAKEMHEKVDKTFLERIATIFPFKYFLNLTFTTHLSEVIQQNRTFPKIAVSESSFPFQLKNPKKPDDLKRNECGFVATIYNLYGTAYYNGNERFNYYYSDDDMLTFISEFNKRFDIDLKNYKEITKESSLLFLGCQYPDWLLRVLINTLAPGSLDLMNTMQTKVFVDYCNDNATIFFLSNHKLQFQKDLQTRPFVSKLYKTLVENKFALNINKADDFVFISYSRDNLDIVQKIVCQLSLHMKLWFDRIKLFPGDEINAEVKKAIKNCRLFLPIITKQSIEKSQKDYIKQEWQYFRDNLSDTPKIIPLIANYVNLGTLGFDVSATFLNRNTNLFYILFDENGLDEQDVEKIKNHL